MAQADQIEELVFLLDRADRVRAGKAGLDAHRAVHAGETGRTVVGRVAKAAGCTPDQVGAWLDGDWEPPTQQRIALMKAAAGFTGAS